MPPVPLLVVLGFAVWTVTVPLGAVALYRWTSILRGARAIESFRADGDDGPGWYRRATRAHANAVENLPVLAAIVWVVLAVGADTRLVDAAALVVLGARVPHTLVHVLLPQTGRVATVRFALFFLQYLAMLLMATVAVCHLVDR